MRFIIKMDKTLDAIIVLVIVLVLFLFGALLLFLAIFNPSWIYNCQDGEMVDCHDRDDHRIEGLDCYCENNELTTRITLSAFGIFTFVIGFLVRGCS